MWSTGNISPEILPRTTRNTLLKKIDSTISKGHFFFSLEKKEQLLLHHLVTVVPGGLYLILIDRTAV